MSLAVGQYSGIESESGSGGRDGGISSESGGGNTVGEYSTVV